jgi:hypothetical protein
MLDIDFLSATHPQLRHHVIYQYSSGLLRSPVRDRLKQLYTAKGLVWVWPSPGDPFFSVYEQSLFGTEAIFIDTVSHENFSMALPFILPNLQTKVVSNSVIFFVPEDAAFLQTPLADPVLASLCEDGHSPRRGTSLEVRPAEIGRFLWFAIYGLRLSAIDE